MTERIKRYILSQLASQSITKDEAKALLLELADSEQTPPVGLQQMDIAIIGMGGRFPRASNLKEFWNILREGEQCVREFPKSRLQDLEPLLRNPYYSELLFGNAIRPQDIPYIHSKSGYLEEIDKFDAAFFGISPKEAIYMDPQHRLALEVAWETMENAGYGGNRLYGSKTGVYIGKEGTNYSYYRHVSEGNPMQLTGSWESLMISRISYLFDFKGPCMLVDTACSAGLVSIHMAAQAVAAGDCEQAIAGGLNMSIVGELKPDFQVTNLGNVESDDGVIRTFDAKAQGTAWGEGIGMVMLKPLQQALESRDHIYAVIKASALNNDGNTNSLVAPKAETQEEVIVAAWKKAGIPPETISYVEAHGTGTILGDPIEFKGLSNAFRRFTDKRQFCAIGSLKTNMGHMVGASGVASLIKVVKSMEHKELPPTLNFQSPNPYINFVDGPLYVNDTRMPWNTDGAPRRAAISSFGFSRTNCHMVVEEPPALKRSEVRQRYYCLTISAQNEHVLDTYIRRYAEFMDEEVWTLPELCYTSNIGRGHYECRVMIIAQTEAELRTGLSALLPGYKNNSTNEQPKIFRGGYTIVSEKKQQLEPGEISKHELSRLREEAMKRLRYFIDNGASDRALLEEIGELYIRGANLDWEVYHAEERRHSIPAPTYPFQSIRCWAEPKISNVKGWMQESLHPLVQQRHTLSSDAVYYETTLNVAEHWVLSDHRIKGRAVLPGTCYLEMVRFAAQKELQVQGLEFQDVFFLIPLLVEDEQECLLRLVFSSSTSTGMLNFAVSSLTDSGDWVTHVEGKVSGIELEPQTVQDAINLQEFISNADKMTVPLFDEYDNRVFTFGPHWDTVRSVWHLHTDALARLQLREELQHELDVYGLHPSIMDNAVNLTSQDTGDTFLPFMYKKIRFYAPITRDVYSHIRLKQQAGETMTYDIALLSPEGKRLVEIHDYTVKRVRDLNALAKSAESGVCMQMVWVLRENSKQHVEAPTLQRPVAVIGTEGPRLRQLESAITARGQEVVVYVLNTGEATEIRDTITPDEQGFDRFVQAADKIGIETVVFAADYTLETLADTGLNDDYELRRRTGVDACFQLCKRLRGDAAKKIKNLKLLLREAWMVDGSEIGLTPLAAATAGLSKVIQQEYRHLHVDVLDASNDTPLKDVIDELFTGNGWRAIRSTGVYVEELQQHSVTSVETELPVLLDGAYIITGGLGGIGLAIAERLADKGRSNVILLGRRQLAAPDKWEQLAQSGKEAERRQYERIHALRLRLNSLEYHSIDVTDAEAIRLLGRDLQQRYGGISGIFHAAGVAGEGFLLHKDEKSFSNVLAPKLNGSINFIRLLQEDNKHAFMVLFSSITALTGGEGQGDYCAANAYMDALADWGSMQGLNICSINWPVWKEMGMSMDYALDETESLFSAIDVREGLDWLEHLTVNPVRRLIPAALNAKIAAKYEQMLPFRFSPKVTQSIRSYLGNKNEQDKQETEVRLKGTLEPSSTQQYVANAFGGLLGLQEIDIYSSFEDMGGNSLITTHLLTHIDQEFPGIIDITDIFSYPTVHDLSELIDSRNFELTPAVSKEEIVTSDGSSKWIEMIEQELKDTEFLNEFLGQMKGVGLDGK